MIVNRDHFVDPPNPRCSDSSRQLLDHFPYVARGGGSPGAALAAMRPDDARAFARWTFGWEALSIAEKQAIKAQHGAEHRQRWLESQPATARQIAYWRALGWTADVSSKAEAPELIDQLRRSRRGDVA